MSSPFLLPDQKRMAESVFGRNIRHRRVGSGIMSEGVCAGDSCFCREHIWEQQDQAGMLGIGHWKKPFRKETLTDYNRRFI